MGMQTTTEAQAMEILTYIAGEVPRYGGNLWSFANSIDRLDQWAASGLRARMGTLCELVYRDAELLERTHVALCFACMGDDYAEKEVAGRFLSLARRITMIDAIKRHPRANYFWNLIDALQRGKFSKEQLGLARKLAAEAPPERAAA
jgi:hypothetical protein